MFLTCVWYWTLLSLLLFHLPLLGGWTQNFYLLKHTHTHTQISNTFFPINTHTHKTLSSSFYTQRQTHTWYFSDGLPFFPKLSYSRHCSLDNSLRSLFHTMSCVKLSYSIFFMPNLAILILCFLRSFQFIYQQPFILYHHFLPAPSLLMRLLYTFLSCLSYKCAILISLAGRASGRLSSFGHRVRFIIFHGLFSTLFRSTITLFDCLLSLVAHDHYTLLSWMDRFLCVALEGIKLPHTIHEHREKTHST